MFGRKRIETVLSLIGQCVNGLTVSFCVYIIFDGIVRWNGDVLLIVCDSTSIEEPTYTMIAPLLVDSIEQTKGKRPWLRREKK